MNIEETETLAFTYDVLFHTSQRHSKLSMNQTEPIAKNVATGDCVLQHWLRTEPSEVQLISHQHSELLIATNKDGRDC